MNDLRNLLAHVGALAILIAVLFVVVERVEAPELAASESEEQIATSTITIVATSTPEVATSSPMLATSTATTTTKIAKKSSVEATKSTSSTPPSNEIRRIENPYSTPALSFETINIAARSALVNMYCSTQSGGLKPITGSGVIIDSRGVILTNAHVAQYVLIAQSGRSDLTCVVRTGGPAVAKWHPAVLYIPPVWVEKHAHEISQTNVLGTGEHDYALLYIATNLDGSPAVGPFPALGYDTREAIGFVDDTVLTASFPVEFAGSTVITGNLYPVTSISTIQRLMTFSTGTADVLSLGGIIQAQRGASGGVVVNQWNKAIGLVTTTSDGATTGERDLHAVTLSYIDRDLRVQTGLGLDGMLQNNPYISALEFAANHVPHLSSLLIAQIVGN